jgi:hypothetical protein
MSDCKGCKGCVYVLKRLQAVLKDKRVHKATLLNGLLRDPPQEFACSFFENSLITSLPDCPCQSCLIKTMCTESCHALHVQVTQYECLWDLKITDI